MPRLEFTYWNVIFGTHLNRRERLQLIIPSGVIGLGGLKPFKTATSERMLETEALQASFKPRLYNPRVPHLKHPRTLTKL